MTVEEWDLTTVISPYLDRHMVFPLLEFIDTDLLAKNLVSYQAKDVGAARLALLRPTHMVDYAMDTYKIVHGEDATIPKEMEEQKHKVYQELEELKKGCAPLDKICEDEEERVSVILLLFAATLLLSILLFFSFYTFGVGVESVKNSVDLEMSGLFFKRQA